MSKTYADFSRCFSRTAYQFGPHGQPWGFVVWQPETPLIVDPRRGNTVAQFYNLSLNPTSGELMEVRDGWVYNTGFRNPDGITATHIKTVREIMSDPNGQLDITVPGDSQHYALWEVPDYPYSIWTHGQFVDDNWLAFAEFSHSQEWFPPEMVTNPFWQGDGPDTRLSVRHHETWYDDGDGKWTMRHCRMDWMALDTGTIWLVHDELFGVDYGMLQKWMY